MKNYLFLLLAIFAFAFNAVAIPITKDAPRAEASFFADIASYEVQSVHTPSFESKPQHFESIRWFNLNDSFDLINKPNRHPLARDSIGKSS